jgi:hypothetical protein
MAMTARHTGRAITLALVTLLAAGCGPAAGERPIEMGPVDTGAGTLASARQFLEGRWQLESFEIHPPGKPPVVLKGSGTLTYDNMSNLRMEIRADETSADMLRAAGIDIRDGIISTEGRTAIDLQNRTLTYVLEGQAPLVQRGPLAMQRPRHWVVDANTLILTTRDEAGRPLSIARWTRTP